MKKIIIILLLAAGYFIISTLYHAGSFNSIEAHSQLIDISVYMNIAGTEDLEIDKENGLLFISSSDRWKQARGEKTDDGVYLLDLNSESEPYKLPTTYKGEFHPHGMSFLRKDGTDYLFAINHNQKGGSVELFKFEKGILVHLKTFKNEHMCCPNDLIAVDVDKFYVSNDHGAEKGFKRILEDYLRIANSYLLYFDGETYSKVYDNLNYANGVNVSADGKTLYMTETTGRILSVLDRNIATGKLTLRFTKQFKTGLDNITIDAEGNLWVASHPKLLDFIGHANNPAKLSPSQVLKLTPTGRDDFKVTEVYLNSGEEISGTSTALYYKGRVYVGVVFESKLLSGSYKQ